MLPSIFGEDLFDDFFNDPFGMMNVSEGRSPLYGKHAKNLMKTDIREKEDGYELAVDLPGFKKDEISVELKDGYLTVSAAKGLDKDEEDKKGRYIRQERYAGSLSRSFYVGDVLTISQAMPYLEVKRVITRTVQEEIPYDTVTTDSADLPFDTYKIEQEGETGLDEVVYEDTYYGDSNTPETVEISRTTLKEPVTRVRLRGTKLANGMVVSGTNGTWVWPVPNYKGISRWMSSTHKGVDIRANYGASIIASDGGVVTTAGWHYSYGNYVIIYHGSMSDGNAYSTLYGHMRSVATSAGKYVKQGELIGYVGSTGNSTGNHLHLEVWKGGKKANAVNPRGYIPFPHN